MAILKDLLAEITKVEGISSAVVVSRDGFVIEASSSNGSMDAEAVGAIISAGIGSSEVIGKELNVGELSQLMIECKRGVIVVGHLGTEAILATVANVSANLGNIRYQIKKRLPEFERAL